MVDVPRIISVDDHVVEPPDLWQSRLRPGTSTGAPGCSVRRSGWPAAVGAGASMGWVPADDGEWCDVWYYDDLVSPFLMLSAAVGFEEVGFSVTTLDQIRPDALKKNERLADMTANHVDAAVCFPNTMPRFCGQAFYERQDRDLAALCVRAYNDWMIDEWSAGDGAGRLIPLTMVPLWDAHLAAAEIHRCAEKGSHAVRFPKKPHPLGLPSIHDKNGFWEPFFTACQETETVVCIHIGSSSRMPTTSPDAPFIISSTLTFQNAMG